MAKMLEKMAGAMMPHMGDCGGGERAMALEAARAGLMAIREPDELTCDAGDDAYDPWDRAVMPSSAIFRRMIDAMLAEPQPAPTSKLGAVGMRAQPE